MNVLSTIIFLLLSTSLASGCNLTVSFPCDGDRCVPIKWRCDGHSDCLDTTDEQNCEAAEQCPISSEFRCSNRQCIPQAWVCDSQDDCGDNSDEVNCTILTCGPDHFQCQSDRKCIPDDWRCDKGFDCVDHSDEVDCSLTTATSQPSTTDCLGFQCHSDGACIQPSSICDSIADCVDESDEKHCTTTTTTTTITSPIPDPQADCIGFQCEPGGMCIPSEWVCDIDIDCENGSDESDCGINYATNSTTTSPCGELQFQCESGDRICISDAWRCDGDADCPDRSDEKNCSATTTTTITTTTPTTTTTISTTLMPFASAGITFTDEDVTTASTTATTLSTPPISACMKSQFRCKSTPHTCIHWSWQCDGFPDCPDKSDEKNCITTTTSVNTPIMSTATHSAPSSTISTPSPSTDPHLTSTPRSCGPDHFQCSSGASGPCLPRSVKCDGAGHCEDLSDEEHCDPLCVVTALNRVTCTGVPFQLLSAGETDGRLYNLSSVSYRRLFSTEKPGIVAVDFHYRKQYVFWTDRVLGQVNRLDLSDKSIETVVSDIEPGRVEGVAVDWVHQHVYWVEAQLNHISVTKLDGSMRRTLINESLHSPRAIVVHPGKRFIFFSDWGSSPGTIDRCGLNGAQRVSIVNTNTGWPNALTIDYEENLLYWVDSRRETISSANFDGHYRQDVLTSNDKVTHPISVAVFRGLLLWSESGWLRNTLYQFNLTSASAKVTEFASGAVNPMDIAFFHPARQFPYPNACGVNNGGCSDFCFPNPDGTISCDCRDGYLPHPSQPTRCVAEGMELQETSTQQQTTISQDVSTTGRTVITAIDLSRTDKPRTSTQSAAKTTVADTPRKKGGMFYMLLMGFRAESESKAISIFEMLRNTAKNASNDNVDVLEMA